MRELSVRMDYEPRDWQREVHEQLRRFSVLVVHRRGGKTVLAVNLLIEGALRTKKTMARFAYIAPFLKQARSVSWDYVRYYCRNIPGCSFNDGLMQVSFANGARLTLYGADNPDALRGMYFDGVVMDEVADMRPNVWWEIVRPALTDRLGWCLFIGTPKGLNLFSQIYFQGVEDADWYTGLYTCYDTEALSEKEIEQAKREMPESAFQQEMLCDFHAATDNNLMSVQAVQDAMTRTLSADQYVYAARVMGVDVAREHGDRSCIARRQGLQAPGHRVLRDLREPELAGQIIKEATSWKPEMIFIDIGYAPGVYDRVVDAGFPATGIHFGQKPDDPRFENKRAEMWWRLAEWVGGGGSLPNDHEILTDFCAPKYTFANVNNKIQLESKKQMKERGMPSPDIGDAYALTHAFEIAATAYFGDESLREITNAAPDYNPWESM